MAELTVDPGAAGTRLDRWLAARLAELSRARLQTLMGSHVDALKLVSCLTLFRHVARALDATAPRPAWTALAAHADAILAAAAAQGYPPCRFTEARSSGSREPPPSGRCP